MPPLAGAAIGAGIAGATGGALATGATLGSIAGSALPSLFGGGGGGGSSQPAAQPVSTAQGQFQSYTPQAQQQQDYQYQGLQNRLGDLAWSGLNALPGGVTPSTQLYPQVQQVSQAQAGVNPDIPGYEGQTYAWGPYGNVALQGALGAQTGYQNLLGGPQNLINYGQQTGAAGLAALPQVQQAAYSPQIGQAVQNILNNPYLNQQLAGAQYGGDIGGYGATLSDQQLGVLSQLASNLPALGGQAATTTGAQIPLLQQLAEQSAQQGQGLAGQAQGLLPQIQGITAPLGGTAQQLLQTGFDPQNALFNQLTQQTRDQANAINAMSGLAGTPYAAGLTNDAMRNLNINWQNQQLQRQAQAAQAAGGVISQQLAGPQQQLAALTGAGNLWNQGAGAAGTLAGQAGGLAGQGLQQQLQAAQGAGGLFQTGLGLAQGGSGLAAQAAGLPAATYNAQQQAALNALAAQSNLAGAGVSQLGGLTSQLGAAGQQPIAGLQAQAQFAGLPYQTAMQQAQNAQTALTNQANFGNQLWNQLPQSVQANALRYLALGQNAASLAGNLGQQNFAQNQTQLGNLGGLLQGGSNLLFGNQGLAGALGGNQQTGLLGGIGNLFSGGGSIPQVTGFGDPAFQAFTAGLG